MKRDIKSESEYLRKKAEAVAKKRLSMREMMPSVPEMMKLIEELEVYQVELEMQNEELIQAKEQAETATELYDFSPSGYFTLSKKGKIIELNLSGAKMLGKERSCLRNSQFGFFVSNDTRPIFNIFLGKVFHSKAKESCEVTLSTNDHLPMLVHLTGIVTKNGEQCFVTVVDITHFKRNEEQIKTILGTTIDGFYLVDTEGRILDTNDSYCSMIGYSREELLKLKVKDIEAADTEEVIKERIQRILETGYDRFETKHLRKDGRVIDIEASVNFLIDEQPKLFCFMRNITERKRAEEILLLSNQKLALHVQQTPLAVIGFDLDGYINEWNPAAVQMFGFTQNEAKGKYWILLVPGSVINYLDGVWDSIVKQKGSKRSSYKNLTKEGKIIDCEWFNTPLVDSDGKTIGVTSLVMDITNQKQTEFELREREVQYRNLADSGLALIWTTGTDGLSTYFNKPWLDFTGRTLEQELGIGWLEGVHPLDKEPCLTTCKYCLDNRAKFDLEFRLRHVSGEYRWFRNIGTPNYNSTGEFIGYIGYCFDITQQKEAKESLRESEYEFHMLAESMPQIVWVTRPDGWNIYFNQQWVDYTGLTLEESYGHGWNKPFHPDDQRRAWDAWENATKNNGTYSLECRLRRADGIYRWWLIRGVPFINENGEITKWYGTCTDIESIKQAEQELLASEEKYRSLFNNSEVGMFRTRIDGSEILEFNEKYLSILNYSHDEVKGRPSINLWADKHERDEMIKMLNASGHVKDFECRILNKQGEIRNCITSLRLYRDKGILEGSILDITERKQVEDALKQSEEKYRRLFDQNPQPMWIYDLESLAFLEVNHAAVIHYGYSKKEFLSMTLKDIRPKEDIPSLLRDVEITNKDYNKAGEWRHIKKNGELIYVQITSHSVIFDSRNARQVLIIDVTERKLADEALRTSRQILEGIINTIPARVFWKDKHLKYLGCNTQFAKDAGYTKPEDVIGKDDFSMVWSDKADFFRADDLHVIGSGMSKLNFEEIQSTPSGEKMCVLTSKVPLRDSSGDIVALLGTYIDITERKKSEEELRKSEALFRSYFEIPLLGVAITSPERGWLKVNDRVCSLMGYSRDEILKMIWAELTHPDDLAKDMEQFDLVLTGKIEKYALEKRFIRKDGEIIWASLAVGCVRKMDGGVDYMIAIIEDITERKHAEDKIKKSEIRFKTIFNDAPLGIALIDSLTGEIYEANPKFAEIVGRTLEEIADIDWMSITHPDDVQLDLDNMALLVKGEIEGFQMEKRYVRPDGTFFWINMTISHLIDETGMPIRHLCMIEDITQRRHEQKALLESEVRWRRAIASSPVPIMIHDEDDQVLQLSAGWTKYSGYSIEDIPTLADWTERAYGERSGLKKEYIDQLFNINQTENNGEWIVSAKNGSKRIWEFQTTPLGIFNNGRRVLQSMAIDITEHRKTENELTKAKQKAEESEFQLKESQKVGHIGSYKTDFIAGYWKSSETLDEIFGIDQNYDRSIKGWLDIVHPDESNSLNDYLMNEVIGKKTAFEREYRIVRINDKQTRWVHGFGATTFDNSGNIIQMIGTIQDVTEHKIFEIELKAAKEHAEQSDRLKSAFLANMSHEIRTPMNGILGFAALLKEPKLTGEEQQEYIGIIEKSGARMLNIINDIISISKVESGQMPISILQTNANELIEYIYTFFKPEAEQKGIWISYKTPLPAGEVNIQTDREKVYAVLTNLVKNAIKFTREGSVEVGYGKKGNCLEFYVKDTGRGIPAEYTGIIFERFRQVDDSLHRKFEGAGLGLSISKAYVEMLGGKIWVESQYREGSVFYFTLPCNGETKEKILNEHVARDIGPDNNTNPEVSGLKIVIAEDDVLSAKLLAKLVKNYSGEVQIFSDGVEAVDACRKDPGIDLILMDIQMSKMDGYEATRQIRKFNKDVIIIAQTAFALSRDRGKAIAAGCDDYIAKPIDKALLTALIKKYFLK